MIPMDPELQSLYSRETTAWKHPYAARRLAAKKQAGMRGINRAGYRKMIKWLVEQEDILPFIEF